MKAKVSARLFTWFLRTVALIAGTAAGGTACFYGAFYLVENGVLDIGYLNIMAAIGAGIGAGIVQWIIQSVFPSSSAAEKVPEE